MSDYRIDAATKEEWAYRALSAEDKVNMLVDNLIALKSYLKQNDDSYYVAAYIDATLQEAKDYR